VSLFKEFREFAVKGNVIDLAVGVIIGAAFGKIVTSLVDDLIMPPVAALLGRVNFSDLKVELRPSWPNPADGKINPAINWNYGQFINVVVQFLIVAWAVFLLVKALNKAKAKFEEPPADGEPIIRECPFCLSEIPAKAHRCKFCATDLPLEQPAVSPA
jgi:large conductance mechanosensitive channel